MTNAPATTTPNATTNRRTLVSLPGREATGLLARAFGRLRAAAPPDAHDFDQGDGGKHGHEGQHRDMEARVAEEDQWLHGQGDRGQQEELPPRSMPSQERR